MNGAAPVTAAGGANNKPRRLVLHFDINKTIVMKDPTNNVNNTTLTVRSLSLTVVTLIRLATCWQTLSGVNSCLRRSTVLKNYNGPMCQTS